MVALICKQAVVAGLAIPFMAGSRTRTSAIGHHLFLFNYKFGTLHHLCCETAQYWCGTQAIWKQFLATLLYWSGFLKHTKDRHGNQPKNIASKVEIKLQLEELL